MSSPVRLRAGDGGHPQLVGICKWWASASGGHPQLVGIRNWWASASGGHLQVVGICKWWASATGGHPQLVGIRNWRASTTVKKQRSPRNGARLDRARGIDTWNSGLIVGESPRQGAASFSSKPVLKTTDNAGGHPSMTLALGVTKSPRHCSRFLFGISESIGICAGLLLSVNRDFCLTAICRRNAHVSLFSRCRSPSSRASPPSPFEGRRRGVLPANT